MTAVAVVTHYYGYYCPGSASLKHVYFYTSFINFWSVTVAMYMLVTLYVACKQELKTSDPVPKFLSIKFVIFFSFWQSVVIYLFTQWGWIHETSWASAENVGTMIHNFLVCVEMFIAAVMHVSAFDYKKFRPPNRAKMNVLVSLKHVCSLRDLFVDLKLPVPKKKPKLVRMPDGTFVVIYGDTSRAFSGDNEDEDATKPILSRDQVVDAKTAQQMMKKSPPSSSSRRTKEVIVSINDSLAATASSSAVPPHTASHVSPTNGARASPSNKAVRQGIPVSPTLAPGPTPSSSTKIDTGQSRTGTNGRVPALQLPQTLGPLSSRPLPPLPPKDNSPSDDFADVDIR
eukprot:CAMPEP_0184650706 /NCGR_PEP_ID=MMETSP0308-20130426/8281_1 /TAXON_ID=38269 /ORGANISM="Gloeochaete witrockiana, Strain SAG 46.84" /LENGTH=342 /DNA_ID=CAMNT_0027084455 /DNA_START=556 /DNA_END=1584 /DNA_ORIENTATION=-